MGDETAGSGTSSSSVKVIEVEQGDEGAEIISSQSKTRSTIYSHFTYVSKTNYYHCKYCNKKYIKPSSGCGSLWNHMRSAHSSKLVNDIQTKIENYGTIIAKAKEEKSALTEEEFRDKLVKFIVTSDQPFALVNEKAFEDFISSIQNPANSYQLPGRLQLRDMITTKFQEMKQEVKNAMVVNAGKLNFVIDCWTSANGHSYQGVIASWIDSNWKLKSTVIDLTRINGSHTGDNLGTHFIGVLDGYEIWDRLLTVTTDNASNMDTLFVRLDAEADNREAVNSLINSSTARKMHFASKDFRVRCLAHIINLSCKAILQVIDATPVRQEDEDESGSEGESHEVLDAEPQQQIISKIRKAVKKIRNSQDKRDFLRKQCEVAGVTANELILDMKIRWNSTLLMLERAVKLKGPLIITLSHYKELHPYQLCEAEWNKLNEAIDMLKPFRDATLLFSRNEPMLSSTLHIYEILFAHLESYLPSDSTATAYRGRRTTSVESTKSWLADAADAGFAKLRKYYPSADGLAYVVATVLDPRRKDKWYSAVNWCQQWISTCKSNVKRLWTTYYKPTTVIVSQDDGGTPPTKRPRNLVEERMEEQLKKIPRGVQEDELTRYYKEPVADETIYVLQWWHDHECQYPNLSKMAKDFLSIFGTGVPVERLFSSATDTLTHRRYRLSPQTINQCLCLKSWYKLQDVEDFQLELAEAIKEKVLGTFEDDQQCQIL